MKKIKQIYKSWKIHFDNESGLWTAEHEQSGKIIVNECRITLVDNLDALDAQNT